MKRFASVTLILAVWLVVASLGIVGYFGMTLPDISHLGRATDSISLTILDRNGNVLRQLGDTYAAHVPVSQMPSIIPSAFIAIEDKRFYSHFGVDLLGVVRAIARNVTAGRVVQGGSTLTQQLAKNLFLTPNRSLSRKVREALLAIWLEITFDKNQILSLYLNRVYFGAGAYGIEDAAQRYFAKSARQVSLAEAAMLAGLVKAPSSLSPFHNLSGAQDRASIVLNMMAAQGYVTPVEADAAKLQPARLSSTAMTAQSDRYFTDWIRQDIRALLDQRRHGDLVIHTTLDRTLQAAAARAIRQNIAREGQQLNVDQAALVAIGHRGAIRAMVGGVDYASSSFNRVVSARRQPGSVFKLVPYTAAALAGVKPDDAVIDQGVTINGWTPKNADDKYRGAMTFREATARSSNSVAVSLTERYGRKHIISLAEKLGLDTNGWSTHPALALGVFDVSLLEITGAYDVVANGGIKYAPFGLRRIETRDGQTVLDFDNQAGHQILSVPAIQTLDDILRAVVAWGTGKNANIITSDDIYLAGKTGTTQNGRDAWFIGYARSSQYALTAGVWTGNDNSSDTDSRGGGLPTRIWRDFMAVAQGNL